MGVGKVSAQCFLVAAVLGTAVVGCSGEDGVPGHETTDDTDTQSEDSSDGADTSDTDTDCRSLTPAECAVQPGCVPLRAERVRFGVMVDNRSDCVEEPEWIGCFSPEDTACKNEVGYTMLDPDGQCWLADGCQPASWQEPANAEHCPDGGVATGLSACGSRLCDDGSAFECALSRPMCESSWPTAAIQDGCWVCVDPVNCTPEPDSDTDTLSDTDTGIDTDPSCEAPPSAYECESHDDCPVGYTCSMESCCTNGETYRTCWPGDCWTQREEALSCASERPVCGEEGQVIIHEGCWDCVDEASCLPLGWPIVGNL